MAAELHRAALLAFAALMLAAAFEDFRRLAIPNWLTLGLCLAWPLYILQGSTLSGALGALGCAVLVFAIGAVLFARGYVGGGDVKLLTAATLWAGPDATVSLLTVTGVLGGVLAMVLLMPPAAHLASLARAKLGPDTELTGAETSPPVPYGIAIAGAALIVTILPQFS
jgi:prepilin peptidase CpaA